MERKKNVSKRSVGRNKRKRSWLNVRKVIPLVLLLFLLLFSMAAAGYAIFFHAAPSQVAADLSTVPVER
jgi:CHASE1-domain containing sensor protein